MNMMTVWICMALGFTVFYIAEVLYLYRSDK